MGLPGNGASKDAPLPAFLFLDSAMPLKYRIATATIALFFEEGRRVAHTVPAGATVTAESLDGDRLVDVIWTERNERIMMFAQDIRRRGEKIE